MRRIAVFFFTVLAVLSCQDLELIDARIDSLKDRVDKLEEFDSAFARDLADMYELVSVIQGNTITEIVEIKSGSSVVGYWIYLLDSEEPLRVDLCGTDGIDGVLDESLLGTGVRGEDGECPEITPGESGEDGSFQPEQGEDGVGGTFVNPGAGTDGDSGTAGSLPGFSIQGGSGDSSAASPGKGDAGAKGEDGYFDESTLIQGPAGETGDKGEMGSVPVLAFRKLGNTYYWAVKNGNTYTYLRDDTGNMLPVRDVEYKPQIKCEEGVLKISFDGGSSWSEFDPCEISAPVLKQVVVDGSIVKFYYSDGSVYAVPYLTGLSLTLAPEKNIPAVPGAVLSISYSYTCSAGAECEIAVKGNRYIGKCTVSPDGNGSRSGKINVTISENHEVSKQKLTVALSHESGVITRTLDFVEAGVFEVSAVPPVSKDGDEVTLNITNTTPYSTYIQSDSGWLTGSSTIFNASANTGGIRVAHINIQLRNAYNTTVMTKSVPVVQYGTSGHCYQEYLGDWTMNGYDKLAGSSFSRPVQVKENQDLQNSYLIYGLSPGSGSDYPVTATYNTSSGKMELALPQENLNGADLGMYPVTSSGSQVYPSTSSKVFYFTSNGSQNTMSTTMSYYDSFMYMPVSSKNPSYVDKVFYYSATLSRAAGARQYSDGEKVVLNSAAAGYTPLNLVIVGDGYVAKDMKVGGRFERAAKSAMGNFFAMEPFRSFKDRFNVYMLTYTSNEEGTDVGTSVSRDTYFNSYCAGGGNTLATVDYNKVLNCVRSAANLTESNYDLYRTTILVLVNTAEQSGSCWYSKGGKISTSYVGDGIKSYAIATLAANTMGASGLVRHELGGHAFGRLADEYNWGAEADNAKKNNLDNEHNNNGFYFNVSHRTGTGCPWYDLIGYDGTGMYEGGWGCSKGIYRPSESSIMLNNQGEFNAPSRRIIYKRIIQQSEGFNAYSNSRFLEYDRINL